MNTKSVKAVRSRALRVARLCKQVLADTREPYITGSALTGELRRASMDLTRALAAMRKSNG